MTLHQFTHWLHGPAGRVHAGIVILVLLAAIWLAGKIPWFR